MGEEQAVGVLDAVRRLTTVSDEPLVLAVSGGLDSMTLLHAMMAVAPHRIAAVATFDHGTGRPATRAAAHVARVAGAAGLRVVRGRSGLRSTFPDGREAAWRHARYGFLRDAARRTGARIATAHTLDDQVETVLMRVMRGSGARGLAGLAWGRDILRPFIGVRRAQLLAYATASGVEWVEDPSNVSPAFARNRIRHDILPALRRADASFDETLLALAQRATAWRQDVERLVDATLRPTLRGDRELVVASAELADYDRGALAMLWGSLAGRVGLALDRRGTRRIAAFTTTRPGRGSIPLAGGWCLEATHDAYILRKDADTARVAAVSLPLDATGWLEWGRFRFRVASASDVALPDASAPWSAAICAESGGLVRGWTAGDRLAPAGGQPRRRVARYLSDSGMHGSERAGWPVVTAGEDVVWIPGVRRSDAATDRSGRPVRHYICERIDR